MTATSIENRDYTLIIDRSGSMAGPMPKGGRSRWKAAEESAIALARELEKHDPDGITVYTFNGKFKRYDNVTASKVEQVFKETSPMGSTGLTEVLEDAFADFNKRKAAGQIKSGDTIIVLTDGEPDEPTSVAKLIVQQSKRLEADEELAVQFIQVGDDSGAKRYLKSLDDDLQAQGAKFDIVDAKTIDEIGDLPLEQVLLDAIND